MKYSLPVPQSLDEAIHALLRLREEINAAGGFVTVTSLADRLSVSKARASEITRRDDFPPAIWTEGQSKFWTGDSVDAWRAESRTVGRPPLRRSEEDHPAQEGQGDGVTNYVVVTRNTNLPVERFYTIESAADYIVREKAFARYTVLVQEGNRITASTPYRKLRPTEQAALEKRLYPTLFE